MIIINRKEIEIYYPITKENKVPVIILNTSHNEGKKCMGKYERTIRRLFSE